MSNNVRKTVIREQLTDPRFYAEMSELLDDLIKQKRDDTDSYKNFSERLKNWLSVWVKEYRTPPFSS